MRRALAGFKIKTSLSALRALTHKDKRFTGTKKRTTWNKSTFEPMRNNRGLPQLHAFSRAWHQLHVPQRLARVERIPVLGTSQ